MSKKEQNAIEQAEKIIERFGGIRPMAHKMDVPVTTVQGWKKRNVIPAGRKEEIVRAAANHNIDLEGLVKSGPANENEQSGHTRAVPEVKSQAEEKSKPEKEKSGGKKSGGGDNPPSSGGGFDSQLALSEKKAVTRSTIINVFIVVLVLGAVMALLWPKVDRVEKNMGAVENDIEVIKSEQSLIRSLIPDNFEQKVEELQAQAKEAKQKVDEAIDAAKVISGDVIGENAGDLEQRVANLEMHVEDLTGGASPRMAALLERIRQMRETLAGQQQLNKAFGELSAMIGGAGGNIENITGALQNAREENTPLGQTLEGVSSQDMKAAVMLLGLAQFRETLNRDNAPFEGDLQILLNLVGEENTELRESLERLAPHADNGVLTPEGLSQEFRSMAGDIVVASLKGEDVSVQEKAQARLNELFSVERDGELITGTDTQSTVVRAQRLLEEGKVEEAIIELEGLEGEAAKAAAPWLDRASATLLAQKAKALATETINLRAYGSRIKNFMPGGTELIQNKETGINILRKKNPLKQRTP